jgi:hypothetical protein
MRVYVVKEKGVDLVDGKVDFRDIMGELFLSCLMPFYFTKLHLPRT